MEKGWRDKLERLKVSYYLQYFPEMLEQSGYKLTDEEKKIVSEWAAATRKMMEVEKLFDIVREIVPYAGYPSQNGCSTCCNYSGCRILP
ncbi:hypothetical protein J7J56_06000 [candidate division WOR-3 bacterium]|nr:hypothetical protein [candidate division WOR-3 bacterium]